MSDYTLRGRCKELAEEAVRNDPSLRLARGHYYCPVWGEQAHWWCVKHDGTVVDPSKEQFPSGGLGVYVEFDGVVCCAQCGKDIPEEDALIDGNGHYAFCSGRCNAIFVGVY